MEYAGKRLIFITGSLSDGGAERAISILANKCADLGADVSMIVIREKKQSYVLSDKVKLYQIRTKNDRFRAIRRIIKLHKLIKNMEAGTLIPFLPIISLYTLMANIGVGRKVIMTERADPNISLFAKGSSINDRIANLLMRRCGLFGLADHMVFQTPDAQNWYPDNIRRKSCIIPNPLDLTSLPIRRKDTREKRIVAAGRFSEEKNFPMLLKAFAVFHKEFPEYTLELYGEGSLRCEYDRLADELGIQSAVKMPGFVNDIHSRMADAAMYVSTSNHEGISNSMLEALAMGVPTIVTDCPAGGARMFVKTDGNGILIPMNDVDALVDAMRKIAEDEKYARSISEASIKIRDELDAERIAKKWLELI